jgi:hypothetical protein
MTAKHNRSTKRSGPGKKTLVTAAVTGGMLAAAGAGAFDVFGSAVGPAPAPATTQTPSLAAAIAPNPAPNPLFAVAQPIDPTLNVGGGAAPAAPRPPNPQRPCPPRMRRRRAPTPVRCCAMARPSRAGLRHAGVRPHDHVRDPADGIRPTERGVAERPALGAQPHNAVVA